jgi:hypothetical protein
VAPIVEVVEEKPTFEEFWRRSKVVREEADRLRSAGEDEIEGAVADPLPQEVPEGTDELGEPLASLPPRLKITAGNLVAGGLCGCGALLGLAVCVLLVVVASRRTDGSGNPIGWGIGSVVLTIVAVGLLTSRPQTNSAGRNFWLCEHGLLWSGRGGVDFCRWDDIHEAYYGTGKREVKAATGLRTYKVVRVKFRTFEVVLKDEKVVFTADAQNARTAKFARCLLGRAAAAAFPQVMRRICKGEKVRFGDVELDSQGLRWADLAYDWADLEDVRLFFRGPSDSYLQYLVRRHKEPVSIPLTVISLPDAVCAVSKLMLRDSPPVPDRPKKTKTRTPSDPFQF